MLKNIISHMKELEGTHPCNTDLARADLVFISVTLIDEAHVDTQATCLLS